MQFVSLTESHDMDYKDFITMKTEFKGVVPYIRDTGIRVEEVLNRLANGWTSEEILQKFSELDKNDIIACLQFATAQKNNGPPPEAA